MEWIVALTILLLAVFAGSGWYILNQRFLDEQFERRTLTDANNEFARSALESIYCPAISKSLPESENVSDKEKTKFFSSDEIYDALSIPVGK